MKTLFTLLLSGFVFTGYSQDSTWNTTGKTPKPDEADAYFGLHTTIPFHKMKNVTQNNMGDNGYGLTLQVLSNPFVWGKDKREGPLRLGAELGYTYYGRFIQDVTVNGFTGSYKTSYGIASLNAIVRVRPSLNHKFLPYLDLIAGGDFYLSSTKENLSAIESGLGIQPFEFGGTSSASFNKGIAAGFSVAPRDRDGYRLYFRASYNNGTTIKYVERNSMSYDPGKNALTYTVKRAPVEYWMFTVGIGI